MVCHFFESAHGGGIIVARLLRRLMEERGHRVDVLCLAGGDEPQPGTVYRLAALPLLGRDLARKFLLFLNNGLFDRWFLRQAAGFRFKPGQYDVIHCQDFLGVRMARSLATRTGASWGVTLHEYLPRQMGTTVPSPALARFLDSACHWRDRELLPDYRAANWLVGVSRALSEAASAFVGPSGPAVRTVHNAFTPVFTAPRASGPASASAPCRFLYVGRLSPEKGVDLLIEAFRRHPGNDSLSILGLDGALRRLVEREAAHDARIRLLPPARYEEMARHYREHDVVCCPAMWEEPFGLTTLEARACGRVVVGTRRGGIPEILEGYARAVLVESRDRTREAIVTDLAAAMDLALALRGTPVSDVSEASFLRHFGTQAFADQYEQIYRGGNQ